MQFITIKQIYSHIKTVIDVIFYPNIFPSLFSNVNINKISVEELYQNLNNNEHYIIDVRKPKEYDNSFGHIENSKFIPMKLLVNKPEILNKYNDRLIVMVCRQGRRVNLIAKYLTKFDFNNLLVLEGGLESWSENKFPLIQ